MALKRISIDTTRPNLVALYDVESANDASQKPLDYVGAILDTDERKVKFWLVRTNEMFRLEQGGGQGEPYEKSSSNKSRRTLDSGAKLAAKQNLEQKLQEKFPAYFDKVIFYVRTAEETGDTKPRFPKSVSDAIRKAERNGAAALNEIEEGNPTLLGNANAASYFRR